MSTQLERELIKELVRRVTYEELTNENLEEIKKIVEEFEKSDYKQAIKNEILKCLGVDTSKYRITASISTIVNSLIYLRLIGVGDVEKVVKKSPAVLALKKDRMQRNVEYLQSVGVKKVGEVVEKSPHVLIYSVERLQENVEYLKSKGLKKVGEVVERFPQVLVLKIDRLRRSVEYLTEEIGLSIDSIEKYPFLLGLSLEKRIKPRWRKMRNLPNLSEGKIVRLLCVSEKEFEEEVRYHRNYSKIIPEDIEKDIVEYLSKKPYGSKFKGIKRYIEKLYNLQEVPEGYLKALLIGLERKGIVKYEDKRWVLRTK